VGSAPVALLPNPHAIKRDKDLVARHSQYRAFSGMTQRTPPRGSLTSPE
jgi:hypothetical protein